jgi:hypothetical protein
VNGTDLSPDLAAAHHVVNTISEGAAAVAAAALNPRADLTELVHPADDHQDRYEPAEQGPTANWAPRSRSQTRTPTRRLDSGPNQGGAR